MGKSPADLARLGGSIRRVRATERVSPDGGKKVWHQGERGCEILSFVDPHGEVSRQEAYLDDAVVVWRRDEPMATGAVHVEAGDGESVNLDLTLNMSLVHDANLVLGGYRGEDRYVIHLREALRAGAPRLAESEFPSPIVRRVTGSSAIPALATDGGTPETSGGAPERRRWTLLGVAIVLVGIAVASAWALR